jgi:Cu-processing system ATP-binding protein
MVKTVELTKVYGKQTVLNGLTITGAAGQSIALIGPNGAGKTTLSKILLGQVIPTSGSVRIDGTDISAGPEYRRQLGYMPQTTRFPARMETHQLFALIKSMRPDVAPADYDTELYDELGIADMRDKALGDLSGGMRQRVSAALAFYFNPRLLILDEPTAGLDPIANEILKAKVRQYTERDRLVITTSHILSDLDEICNYVVFLMEGHLRFAGPIDELRRQTRESKLNRMVVALTKNAPVHA